MDFLIGGYKTTAVTRWRLNLKDRILEYRGSFESGENPSWLSFSKSANGNSMLFIANELDSKDGTRPGALSIFKYENKEFSFINRVSTVGTCPCHVMVTENKEAAIVSNYLDGRFSVFPLSANGDIKSKSSLILIGADPTRPPAEYTREGCHAHFSVERRGSVYSVDLGLDFIFQHPTHKFSLSSIEESSAPVNLTLSTKTTPGLQLPLGSGPRQIKFHPFLDTAFVVCESSNTIFVINVDAKTGSLTLPSTATVTVRDQMSFLSLALRLFFVSVVAYAAAWYQNEVNWAVLSTLALLNFILISFHYLGIDIEMGFQQESCKHVLQSNPSTLRNRDAVDSMGASELVVSADGRYLYVSNRDVRADFRDKYEETGKLDDYEGEDDRSCITVYRIHAAPFPYPADVSPTQPRRYQQLLKDGNVFLELIQEVYTGGNHPRHFLFINGGAQMLIANQWTRAIAMYDVNQTTGLIDEHSLSITSGPKVPPAAVIVPVPETA